MHFTGETTAHMEMISITWHLKQILTTLELTAKATGSGYKIITVNTGLAKKFLRVFVTSGKTRRNFLAKPILQKILFSMS